VDILPSILTDGEAVSAVVEELVQGIQQEEVVQTELREEIANSPEMTEEQAIRQMQSMARQWMALEVLQRVFEMNMQTLRSISGIKSQANGYLKSSNNFNNPFMDLSVLAQLQTAPTPGTEPQQQCGQQASTSANTEQTLSPEDEILAQLMDLLSQQWLSLQSGQVEWKTLENALNANDILNVLNNNLLDNQSTSTSAQLADLNISSVIMQIQDIL
jgi:hypothetical protein